MASSNSMFISLLLFYTCLFYLVGVGMTPDIITAQASTEFIDSYYYLSGGSGTSLCSFTEHDFLWFGDGYYDCDDDTRWDFDEVTVESDGTSLSMADTTSPSIGVSILSIMSKIPIIKIIVPLLGGILVTISGTFPVILTTLIFAPLGTIAIWLLIRFLRGDGS